MWEAMLSDALGRQVRLELVHLGNGRTTYAVKNGQMIFKVVDDCYFNEIRFYKEVAPTMDHCPKVYLSGSKNGQGYVLMEYLQKCKRWGKYEYEHALRVIAAIHSQYWNKSMDDWIPNLVPVQKDQELYFESQLEQADIPQKQKDILRRGAWDIAAIYPKILGKTVTLLHGDLSYVNAGYSGKKLLFYDWSNVHQGSPAYDLGYLIEQLDELFGDSLSKAGLSKRYLTKYYLQALEKEGVNGLDENTFSRDCVVSYLYRCLFSYIPAYIRKGNTVPLKRKVDAVCGLIRDCF